MEQEQTDAMGDLVDDATDVPEAPVDTAEAASDAAPEEITDTTSTDVDAGAADDISVAEDDIIVTDDEPEAAADPAPAGDDDDAAVEEAAATEEEAAEEPASTEEVAAADVSPADDADVADEDALFEEEVPAAPRVQSPYDRPGRWYVVHTQSGHEKKAQQNLQARTASMNMGDKIYETVIPMEDVAEFRNGKKVIVQKKMFPGYLLVRAEMNDDAWYVIRNTPSIVNFVGSGGKPSPLLRREVENFLHVPEEGGEAESSPRTKARLEYGMGETVRVKDGPFSDFSGEIVEINEDQLKVKVLVNIFGRETPVELEFSQIARL